MDSLSIVDEIDKNKVNKVNVNKDKVDVNVYVNKNKVNVNKNKVNVNKNKVDVNKDKVDVNKDKVDVDKNTVVKKKRGRKKKIKTPEEIERERNKPKQRRGRKPKSLFNQLTEENTKKILNNNDDDETIILNLKINKKLNNKNINNEILDNNNILNDTILSNNELDLKKNINSTLFENNILNNKELDLRKNINSTPDGVSTIQDYYYLNNEIDNNNYNNYDILNDDSSNLLQNNTSKFITNHNCYWCCHSFNNQPFGIPFKYKNDKFYTNGNFCSLECATSFNFNEKKNIQDIWECYNLINFMSHKLGLNNKVKMAPYRECLKCFGGNLTIDEFRNQNINTSKLFNQLEYPLISVQTHIEEINYNENISNDFIPIDKERLNRLEQKVKLSKKNLNYINKNSLEQTMNIKIKTT